MDSLARELYICDQPICQFVKLKNPHAPYFHIYKTTRFCNLTNTISEIHSFSAKRTSNICYRQIRKFKKYYLPNSKMHMHHTFICMGPQDSEI